jgi:hypothetical protein
MTKQLTSENLKTQDKLHAIAKRKTEKKGELIEEREGLHTRIVSGQSRELSANSGHMPMHTAGSQRTA